MSFSFRAIRTLFPVLLLAACAGDRGDVFRDSEQFYLERGYLRTERDPADVSFDADDLKRNFLKIALRVEKTPTQDAKAVSMRRWQKPIRYKIYGQATPEDRRRVGNFMNWMSDISGVEIKPGNDDINYPIFILSDPAQQALARVFREETRTVDNFLGSFLSDFAPRSPCRGRMSVNPEGGIEFVAVLIKAEVTGIVRRSCIEEELSQGMGLINDDDTVRPSIFNDQQEFAVLTTHDELLLRILYDDALTSGTGKAEIAPKLDPIVRRVMRERPAASGPATVGERNSGS